MSSASSREQPQALSQRAAWCDPAPPPSTHLDEYDAAQRVCHAHVGASQHKLAIVGGARPQLHLRFPPGRGRALAMLLRHGGRRYALLLLLRARSYLRRHRRRKPAPLLLPPPLRPAVLLLLLHWCRCVSCLGHLCCCCPREGSAQHCGWRWRDGEN